MTSLASTFISTMSPRSQKKRSENEKIETDISTINENTKNEKKVKNENTVDKKENKKMKREVVEGIKEVENVTLLDIKLNKKSEKLRNTLSLSLLSKNGDVDMRLVNQFK
jgi:hypothetical protein